MRSVVRRLAPWVQELALVLGCYWLYTLVRNLTPHHREAAFARAGDVLQVEHVLHLDVERSVNAVVAARPWLAQVCDYYYAVMHFAVTVGVLVWLWRRHRARYPWLRTAWLGTNVSALAGFAWYALAPPRLLPGKGYVDTVVHFHTWGSFGSGTVDRVSNQLAAMPSLHIGWALWCALAVTVVTRRRWLRLAVWAYPLLTLLVVVGTANHYVLDAVGGAGATAVGLALATGLDRLRSAVTRVVEEHPFVRRPRPAGGPPVVLEHVLRGTGGIAEAPRQRRAGARVGGDDVAGPAGREDDRVAHPGDQPPGLGQDSGVVPVQ
jgi:hypothetical protein